jgi:hypothetical protein
MAGRLSVSFAVDFILGFNLWYQAKPRTKIVNQKGLKRFHPRKCWGNSNLFPAIRIGVIQHSEAVIAVSKPAPINFFHFHIASTILFLSSISKNGCSNFRIQWGSKNSLSFHQFLIISIFILRKCWEIAEMFIPRISLISQTQSLFFLKE